MVTTIDRCEELIFTPGTVVPQGSDGAVVYSSGALDSFGTDETPVDWPTTGAKIKAIEVELTNTTPDFPDNGRVQLVACDPAGLSPLPGATSDASGTWSGADGYLNTYRSGTADAYYLNKFGGWATEYLTFPTTNASGNAVQISSSTGFNTAELDVAFRCRLASWSTASGATPVRLGNGLWNIQISSNKLALNLTYDNGSTGFPELALSNWGVVNNDWCWFRVTFDATNKCRFWASTDGASWSVVGSDTSMSRTALQTGGTPQLLVGNGQNSPSGYSGFGGDISHMTLRSSVGGTVLADLNLDAMASSTATTWANDPAGLTWTRGSGATVTGATIPATVRLRIDLETPCLVEDLRLIVDAQTGALTVDEILLEAECGGGIYVDGAVHLA